MMTSELEVEVDPVLEHLCPTGKFKLEWDGPYFMGEFRDGQEYSGQHLYYANQCTVCRFMVERMGHAGRCYQGDEIRFFDSTWSEIHQTFVHPNDGTAPGWPSQISEIGRAHV